MSLVKRVKRRIQKRTRGKRINLFFETIAPTKNELILNVGGTGYFFSDYKNKENVIILNSDKRVIQSLNGKTASKLVVGDACLLPFKDKSIDVAFSNAVIEHVGGSARQMLFAAEIRRAAQKYFVATPNKWFFLDLHYHLPFYQFVPKRLQRFLSRYFRIGGHGKGYWIDVNLLSESQLKKLFPKSKIIKQTLPFYPEVLIAASNGK